jgi:hypothetical protein
MLKTESENMVRRALEESGARFIPTPVTAGEENPPQFTDEQVTALADMIRRICARSIEEAFASWRPGSPGSKPTFFTD